MSIPNIVSGNHTLKITSQNDTGLGTEVLLDGEAFDVAVTAVITTVPGESIQLVLTTVERSEQNWGEIYAAGGDISRQLVIHQFKLTATNLLVEQLS